MNKCANCSVNVRFSELTRVGSDYYCLNCRDERGWQCICCEEWFPMLATGIYLGSGNTICESCLEDNPDYEIKKTGKCDICHKPINDLDFEVFDRFGFATRVAAEIDAVFCNACIDKMICENSDCWYDVF